MNNMCKDCLKLGCSCNGTDCTTWTGCVFKTTASSEAYDNSRRIIGREDLNERNVNIPALIRAI